MTLFISFLHEATAATLSRLLRSDFQGQLLSTLFLLPEQERSLTELARHLDAGRTTVHTELERLTTAGRARMVRAERPGPFPRNVDVLLVGDVEATCVQRAASEAKEALRQSVRFTVVEPRRGDPRTAPSRPRHSEARSSS